MQAGGRRFDPVQLHQKGGRALRDALMTEEGRSKQRYALFASGFLNQCYRLLFNNTEEVKQILLGGHDGGRKLSVGRVERDGLDCIDLPYP